MIAQFFGFSLNICDAEMFVSYIFKSIEMFCTDSMCWLCHVFWNDIHVRDMRSERIPVQHHVHR